MTKQAVVNTETAAKLIEYVPLADTYLSEMNPRQEADEEGIALLAETLVQLGLLQNLIGFRDDTGKVGVVGGGRRWRALNIAVALRPDLALVPFKMAPTAQAALEWANAENNARENLELVDDVQHFSRLADMGLTIGRIGQVSGKTEAYVRRRLALAGLPCPVLDALKAGQISIGQAQAMTVSDNETKILEVLERAKDGWFNEYQIKTALKPQAIEGDDRKARFVGQEAYESEGGTVTQDLFEDATLFNDPDILGRVFSAKLDAAAAEVKEAEGWAWSMTTDDSNPFWYELERDNGFARTNIIKGDLTEEQQARYNELVEVENILDEASQTELENLQQIIDGYYSAEQKALSGIVVHVSRNGTIGVTRGAIKTEDQDKAVEAGLIDEPVQSVQASSGEPEMEKPAFSQKFMDDMTAIRLASVQTGLLCKPDYLLSLYAFAVSPASGDCNSIFAFGFGGSETNRPEVDDQFILDPRLGGERDDEAEEAYNALREMAGLGKVAGFKVFREAGKKVRNGAITAFLARAFKTQSADFMADIEAEIGADVRSIWTPSATNCFKRLKGHQLDALYQYLLDLTDDSAAFKSFAKTKKGEKNEAMHKLFNDSAHQDALGVTSEQKDRIATWVPDCIA
ncbi:ParB/RepB/Spo0J family partition protein (plasmid) [Phaeobacter piscinae]|uniref:ParB/RepB/Spo0J family partition protein n=1 Tax=Phaeobacter piscinae TaxID=1580596 RepID=A0ABN5DL81_9RHOB|nr:MULTISPECIES: ParB/RepB/Spo0J family partition protein [Phaeobacter]ATG38115.1 ParB/RepB/Spo0J family partition protein [Phaeobacter piscinae]AUQ88636.1 ParB/RepB/Spo0J family partition protein [Phaeobacter piscinae]AUQ92635.1 ParB/RepB/Spo0J family partition protein [Phaeobacter inhibens]AUR26441.1 ParB/RepB/Spo0J family partition protein [Phaeobacter piscinae]